MSRSCKMVAAPMLDPHSTQRATSFMYVHYSKDHSVAYADSAAVPSGKRRDHEEHKEPLPLPFAETSLGPRHFCSKRERRRNFTAYHRCNVVPSHASVSAAINHEETHTSGQMFWSKVPPLTPSAVGDCWDQGHPASADGSIHAQIL